MEEQVLKSTVEEVVEGEDVGAEKVSAEDLRQERITACNKEISTILQKYGCTLDATITLRAGQVIPGIQIVPVELIQQARPQPE
jgi:hypothetical protein